MNIRRTKQVSLAEIRNIPFDIVIMASGYESRASFLANIINDENIKFTEKIVLGFKESFDDPIRKNNDKIFTDLGYTIDELSGDETGRLSLVLHNICKISSEEVNVLIDYSCMTRVWYAYILSYLNSSEMEKKINLYFSYTHSKYIEGPKSAKYNKYVAPIDGFYSLSVPDRPAALIIGLGYIELRAFGLSEFFDVQPHLFISDPKNDIEYHLDVLNKNSRLINSVPRRNLTFYPLHNLLFTESQLSNLCLDLMTSYRVVLAPCGPKPFTLLCLLTSLRMRGVDVWRISGGSGDPILDKVASGEISILEVSFY
ncbi:MULTISPECIES: hypothetical protein [unclassified Chitinophaga]|uniref:hypothetical protein n=1 Tax=unclassified Chitinophaga TaxID=2619133 RepID=UPI0030102DB5